MARSNEMAQSTQDKKFESRLLDTYRYLCNTDSMNKQLTTQDVNEVRSIMKQVQTPLNVNCDPIAERQTSLPKFTDRFRRHLEQSDKRSMEQSDKDQTKTPPDELDESPQENETQDDVALASENGDDTVDDDRVSITSGTSHTSRSSRSGSGHHRRKRRPETYEQTKQKKGYLGILNTLIKEGYTPTQKYTMRDSLQDIKEEIDQYYTCIQASSYVAKRKANVENGAEWIETGTNIWSLFNPKQPLQLQGLRARIKEVHESKQVDVDWERIYYTYRRKRMESPLWALAITYGSAIISTTLANYATKKLNSLGGGGGAGGSGAADNPLGGIIQNLLGGLLGGGGQKASSDMPSMVRDLPTTSTEPSRRGVPVGNPFGPSGFGRPQPPQPPTYPSPPHTQGAAPRRFQRNVFF